MSEKNVIVNVSSGRNAMKWFIVIFFIYQLLYLTGTTTPFQVEQNWRNWLRYIHIVQ